MKIRNGFVSNSSTSSFLIFGKYFDDHSVLDEMFKNEEDFEDMEIYEKLETATESTELEYHIPYYDDFYIGMSWDSIKDEETGLEFKHRVLKNLQTIFPDLVITDLSTYSEAWRDG